MASATTIRCSTCHGDGWVIDHADECYDAQECVGCGGVQRSCPVCEGTGRTPAPDETRDAAA